MRLDVRVSEVLNISRNKSSELIKRGDVFVNKERVKKPSFHVNVSDTVFIDSKPPLVSRAGEKLDGFLKHFYVDIEDKICLDVGSSTGGFVQVLLSYNPKKIIAVDVGKNQLHESLRGNDKIKLHEECDIRDFNSDEKFDVVTCDVSFISFKDVARSIDKFAKDDIIILFKPQFEVGREAKRDKKGVVCDKGAILKSMEEFERFAFELGWILKRREDSVLKGKEGNLESFYAFKKR